MLKVEIKKFLPRIRRPHRPIPMCFGTAVVNGGANEAAIFPGQTSQKVASNIRSVASKVGDSPDHFLSVVASLIRMEI